MVLKEVGIYILNMQEFSQDNIINFYKQYLNEIEFNLLTTKEKSRLWANLPDKEFFESKNCPQDILDRIDKAHKDSEEFSKELYQMREVLTLREEILNCLEALALKKKITIIGEWQGEDTKIIINNWEEIDQLLHDNSIPNEIINQYEETAKTLKIGKKDLLIYLYSELGKSNREIANTLGLSANNLQNISQRKNQGREIALDKGLPALEQYKQK